MLKLTVIWEYNLIILRVHEVPWLSRYSYHALVRRRSSSAASWASKISCYCTHRDGIWRWISAFLSHKWPWGPKQEVPKYQSPNTTA